LLYLTLHQEEKNYHSAMSMNFGYALVRRNRFSVEGKKRLVQTELAIFKETLKLSQPELPYQVESILAFIQEHLFENWLNFKEIKRRTGSWKVVEKMGRPGLYAFP